MYVPGLVCVCVLKVMDVEIHVYREACKRRAMVVEK